MIRLWIPSFYDNDRAVYSNTRAVDDGEEYDIIGCGSGTLATKLIKGLKEHGIRSPYLHVTKISYDNYCGIREIINDFWFEPKGLYCPNPDSLMPKVINNEQGFKHIQVEIMNLKAIIQDAKKRKIPVFYLTDGQVIQHGDIKIICNVNQIDTIEADDNDGSAYIDNKTICYWLPDIRYLATGNRKEDIYQICIEKNLNPVFLRLPNHGKYITWQQAQNLKELGVSYCWDNSDENTEGKKCCVQAGITFFNCHKDINVVFANGKGIISVGNENYIYDVPYNKGKFEEGWVKNFDGWWYRYKDGSWATGWTVIKWRGQDTVFYFNESGYTVQGWQYLNNGDRYNWYYFDPLNGNMRTGWVKSEGLWYYFDEYTGMHQGWLEYEGKRCYFEPSTNKDKSPAYYNRIALIDDEIWEFDKKCYGKKIEL